MTYSLKHVIAFICFRLYSSLRLTAYRPTNIITCIFCCMNSIGTILANSANCIRAARNQPNHHKNKGNIYNAVFHDLYSNMSFANKKRLNSLFASFLVRYLMVRISGCQEYKCKWNNVVENENTSQKIYFDTARQNSQKMKQQDEMYSSQLKCSYTFLIVVN